MELDPLSNELTTLDNSPKISEDITVEIKLEWPEPHENDVSVPQATNNEVEEKGIGQEYPALEPAQAVKEDGLAAEKEEKKEEKPLTKMKIKKKKDKIKKIKKKKLTDKKEDGSTPKEVKKLKKKKLSSKNGDTSVQQDEHNGFLYYACSVCETKYTTIEGLYKHVLTHKNRVTSWDLRVQSLKLKKKLRKEQKRLKKQQIKQEGIKIENEYVLPNSLSEFVENLTGNVTNIDNENFNSYSQSNQEQINGLPSNADQNNSAPRHEERDNGLAENLEPFMKLKRNGDLVNVNKAKWNKKGSQYTGADETLRQAFNLEKIFKCGHCQKQFHLGYYLKLHVRSHTGEKPYSCEECGISFITASKLGRHKKRTHLSVRFVCRICRRPYTRLEFLTRHFNKQHAADKIEGEPYDYNAILPYLKELEEELQKKKEQEDRIKKEAQFDLFAFPPLGASGSGVDTKPEALWPFAEDEVKLEVKQEIKVEVPDPSEVPLQEDSFVDDSFGDDLPLAAAPPRLKNEDPSDDEDYFPSDTWLPPASPPLSPTPQLKEIEDTPRPRKRRLKDVDKSDNPLQCSICKKGLSSASYMRIHMRTHTGDKPYKCYLCNKSFITSSKRNRHVMTHDNWVDKCKDKLKNEDGAEEGDIKDEPTSDTEEGKLLSKLAKRTRRPRKAKHVLDKLAGKEKRNRKKKPFACLHCCSRFAYPEGLQLHMHAHQSGEKPASSVDAPPEGGFTCKYCLTAFEDLQQGQQHELTHDPSAPKPYLCTVCGRTYQRKETMIYHRRHHDYPNKYQCDVCPKTFNLLCKLQRHLHSHRPDKFVVRYECPVCAHIFNTKYHIEMHLTTHEKEGVILQENRGQIIAMVMQNARKIPLDTNKTTSNLDLVPDDERSRVCNICGEIFSHFYSLEQHLKTHGSKFSLVGMEDLDERKYKCKVCNKGFKLSYYLKLHSYTHTKEKPFICQQCGKGFITRGKLKRHLETHAGLKKYQCHICCKFFTRPSYLRIHVRTIHGHQDFNFKPDLEYEMEMPMSGSGLSVTSHSNL